MQTNIKPVAIIGGGITGLTAGARGCSVTVYEATGRMGERRHSQTN